MADGYDDAHRDRLPLIVTYTDAARHSDRLTPPRGARTIRALESIGGAALAVDRSTAFWTSVTGHTSARDANRRPRLQGGIAKIWLDGFREMGRYQLSMTGSGLSPAPLPYRLVSENSRDAWNVPYSTATRTECGFTSRAGATGVQAQLPLIQLDYGIATDASGRAGRHAELAVTASHLAGSTGTAAVDEVGLEVSYDDGVTWHRAAPRHSGTTWRTRLDAHRAARFVSLRVNARDARGNSVWQSVVRAFGLT
ncbi:hypothetical protein [Streptomyces flaveolus]|uniref:hypothetical protein n=1 Tax=Streptomyces flaveolus TaxID=67297 RepID=UPI0034035CED